MSNRWRRKSTGEEGELTGSIRDQETGEPRAVFQMDDDEDGEFTLVDPVELVLRHGDWEKV